MAVVELIDVSKRYGSTDAVVSLSLRIEQGEFVALLGPSGCGKTTTLNMLAGFVPATSGEILIGGRSMRGVQPHKRNIGVVFQSYALFSHLNVFENVAFGLKMRKVQPRDRVARVRGALELVRLTGLEERYVRELSGGQQQRVALARALVIEPSTLLLDEPLSNLDASLREQMRFEIREIQQRIGITTVFVTHDQGEAMATADRLVVMNTGRVHQIGTVRQVYETPADVFVASFIGQANLLRGVVKSINAKGASVLTAEGSELRAARRGGIADGDRVVLVLRPEDARVASAPLEGYNNVRGVVERVSYLGSTFNVGINVSDGMFTMHCARSEPVPRVGEQVYVAWLPERCSLIAAEG